MSETLYRKYRPTTFADVFGQEHVKTILMNQLKQGTVAHAYLFAGPRGVGKTTVARLLAKAVNCQKLRDAEPCETCAGCLAVSEGKTMDVFEIDAASHTGVDNVRENIIEAARFAPTSLQRKVFIIDEVHGLSTPAFNALLKTLEEPPAHVLFILATTELHKVPETIISRCQRFDFHRLDAKTITERLSSLAKQESIKVDPEVFSAIARLSEGCLRDAESLLGQVLAVGDGKKVTMDEASLIIPATNMQVVLAYLEALSRGDASSAVEVIRSSFESGVRVEPLQDEILSALQWILLDSIGSKREMSIYDVPTQEAFKRLGGAFGTVRIDGLLKRLLEYRSLYRNERIPELPLELLAVESTDPTIHAAPTYPAPVPPTPTSSPAVPKLEVHPPETHNVFSEAPPSAPVPSVPSAPIEPPIAPASSSLKTSLQQVKSKWTECCNGLSEVSGTLPVMLHDVEILGFDGSTLRIGTKIGFIAEKLNEPKNRGVISSVLQRVFQEPMGVRTEVSVSQQDELVSELIGEFGGQVV